MPANPNACCKRIALSPHEVRFCRALQVKGHVQRCVKHVADSRKKEAERKAEREARQKAEMAALAEIKAAEQEQERKKARRRFTAYHCLVFVLLSGGALMAFGHGGH